MKQAVLNLLEFIIYYYLLINKNYIYLKYVYVH